MVSGEWGVRRRGVHYEMTNIENQNMKKLPGSFYQRENVIEIAKELLGKVLLTKWNGVVSSGRIVEVEAYNGIIDKASHAFAGRRTARNEIMYANGGVAYVYLCYGVHWMMNVVARPPGVDYPGAILIRAIEPIEGLHHIAGRRAGQPQRDWANGPGRLTRAIGITKAQDGLDMIARGSPLYFETGESIPDHQIMRGPRIGIHVPEPSRSWEWRFWVKDNPHVSRGGK